MHVVVTTACDGDDAMEQFKVWTSRRLSDQPKLTTPVARKAGRRHWWTEGGDSEAIDDEQYLENAIRYVVEMQGD